MISIELLELNCLYQMFHLHLSTVVITFLELTIFSSSVLQDNVIECSIIEDHL